MRNKKVYYIVWFFCTALLAGVVWFGYNFTPGSYPHAETYILEYSDENVKEAIKIFKQDNPDYIVPDLKMELSDGQSEEAGHWYYVYFYYKDKNKIIFSWIRPIGNSRTRLAIVGINEGLHLGNWKNINKDFDAKEITKIKDEFEERILNPIQSIMKNK